MAEKALTAAAREEERAADRAKWEAEWRARRASEAKVAVALSRAVIRAFPESTMPAAAAVLDIGRRDIRVFTTPETMELLPDHLGRFDLLAAPDITNLLHRLGMDVNAWRLVDLTPPQKTVTLNRSGRKLKLTLAMLISHSTGMSRPLGEPTRMARYLREGQLDRLARRLESDVKALHAIYQYGILHNSVRCRWGFLDRSFHVDWGQPGDRSLYDVLKQALETGAPVDVVFGNAPGWQNPWSRAQRCAVLDVDAWSAKLHFATGVRVVDRHEIQAVRIAP